ncbi:MAG TPA: EamA family transporter [bacterium]|nr:EamA family transporter [bacterium]
MMAHRQSSTATIVLVLLTVYALWGSSFAAIKIAMEAMPPFALLAIRWIVAGALLYAWSSWREARSGEHLEWRHWRSAFFIGGAVIVGGIGGVAFAEQSLPSGTAALLVSTSPAWALLISYGVWRERIAWPTAIGLVIGLGGLALLVHPTHADHFSPIGVTVGVAAAISWAVGSVYTPRVALPRSPALSASMQMLAAGVILLAAALTTGEIRRVHWTWDAGLALVYLTMFSSLIGFIAYTWLLSELPITISSTVAYVAPVVAVFVGWQMLHERVTPSTLLATGIVLLGVALMMVTRTRSRPQRSGNAAPSLPPLQSVTEMDALYCDCP